MGRLRRQAFGFALSAILLLGISACGGHRPPGVSLFPAKITLSPSPVTSMQLGSPIAFIASAQNGSGGNINTSFTFTSSNTSILQFAPGGVACAGSWNLTYTVCTPGATGEVEVIATADNVSSAPTLVYVHPPIDNITVNGFSLNGIPPQEPCLSQSMTMTVEAHAFSQGNEITSLVGPFTWSANNSGVVRITPIVTQVVFQNFIDNIALNQATLTAVNPGLTQIYATANGASSVSSFTQMQYQNSGGTTSPPLDFFETCNIQNVTLQIGNSNVQQNGQTTFAVQKGAAEPAIATVSDIMGYGSLPTTNGGPVLSKIPLTWSTSQPAAISVTSGCTLTCNISTPSVGSATVTAACSPPTCNIGFPYIPPSLSTPAQIATCTSFFQAQYPQFAGCEQLIPQPVYALSPVSTSQSIPQTGGISGLVTGATATATVLASSTGCAAVPPITCTTGIYSFATAKDTPGSVNIMPTSGNSLLFDLGGDRAYVGSQYGAQLVNPANFGTTSGIFTPLGNVTGQVIAISNNGAVAAFSDTMQTPNQVYIVSAANVSAISYNALNINQAVSGVFSPDGLKAFILGDLGDTMYVYSALQALQGPGLEGPGSNPQLALTGRANSIAFSANGAFAFVAETSLNNSTPNVTTFSVCDNSVVPTVVTLPSNPLFMRVLPAFHIPYTDSSGNPIPDGVHIFILDSTGFDVITATITSNPSSLCPQTLTFAPFVVNGTPQHYQRVELGQGTIQPINFFASTEGSLLYVVVNDSSGVLAYDFGTRSVSAIPLQGDAIPQLAGISVDGGTIVVDANDGKVHELSTNLGGSDLFQIPFPDLPDYLNPFCSFTPSSGPCTFDLLAVRP